MHLKRLNASKMWNLEEIKSKKWITKKNPGPHSKKLSIPANILLKEIIGCSQKTRESKWIIANKKMLVNKKIINTIKFPIGLFDTIELANMNKIYRLTIGENRKFIVKEIKETENGIRPCRVISKKTQKKGIMQINLDNGMNLLSDKKEVKIGDTLVIDIKENKIKNHLKFEKGALVMIIDGKYIGKVGTLKEIKKGVFSDNTVKVLVGDNLIETSGGYAFVLDSRLSY